MLGSPILWLKGMRILMFQLSGFYYRVYRIGILQDRLLREMSLNPKLGD